MSILLTKGTVYTESGLQRKDVIISSDKTSVFVDKADNLNSYDKVIDAEGKVILPGFTDVHVHFREPGFFYKETIKTGSEAAARGGYTCVCSMPNLNPVPSTYKNLKIQLDIINRDAVVRVIPYGTITMEQNGRSALADMKALAPYVCAFSDDGKGIQTGPLMKDAMILAKSLDKIIVAHCEDESILGGTSIHDGKYALSIGHKGISSESEWKQIERDVKLSEETGCPYHVCHISTKESVEIIRDAKASGIDVTCETGPHYLTLCEDDLMGLDPMLPENGRFKMNPPLRSKADYKELIRGLCDGTIDMIATDHAPHSEEEKYRGILNSAFGIVGLETAFPVLYTKLVKEGVISLEKLTELLAINPRKRFNLPGLGSDYVIIDLNKEFTINPETFASKGHSTPFEGWKVQGEVETTIMDGQIVYEKTTTEN